MIYSAGSGLGYLICKGFFDTIPISLRESAKLEGASEFTIFTRIVIPLSKPIIVYTVINSFLAPWMDFVMARLMIKSKNPADWTVAIGLFNMLQKTLLSKYFSVFCAGGVVVAIPISVCNYAEILCRGYYRRCRKGLESVQNPLNSSGFFFLIYICIRGKSQNLFLLAG